MKKLGDIRLPLSIFVVAALVVAIDVVTMPVLLTTLPTSFIVDFGVVLLTGLVGLCFAPRVGCPFWWRPSDDSPTSRRVTHVTALLSLFLVIGNTVISLYYIDQAVEMAPWLALLTPEIALAISLRAALNEETVFRFFLFPLAAWAVRHFVHSQKASLVIGALVSTLIFGLIHPPSGFFLSVSTGLALIYIYQGRGLLPAMAVHFFADAIPFVIISMMP